MQLFFYNLYSDYSIFQFRHTAFTFAQKELAPKAYEIDKTDSFPDRKVC